MPNEFARVKNIPINELFVCLDTIRDGRPLVWEIKNHGHFGADRTLLMTEKIVREWNFGINNNEYRQSAGIRDWLNGSFYSGFSSRLKSAIVPTTINTGVQVQSGVQIPVTLINQNVFILSAIETGLRIGDGRIPPVEGNHGSAIPSLWIPHGIYSNQHIWTRSSIPGSTTNVYTIFNNNEIGSRGFSTGGGYWPAICIDSDVVVKYQWVNGISDFAYVLQDAGHLPTYTKIGANNKKLVKGYTKIGGQVREIAQGYTKINGVIRRIF